ncbi:unnamed protein product [Urochloa decumbens]|uniref:Uncharacterized protein n=1 Tax=Urochloa decumbens TaxID=240449 RepID=A0ABC8Z5Q0_9POAL
MAAAGLLEEDGHPDLLERNPCAKRIVFTALAAVFSTLVLLAVWDILFGFVGPEFWVKIPGVEGLDRSVDATKPPTFNITLRVNNEGNRFWEICGKGGRVDVAYEDVPLAHGQLPDFCVPPGVVGSVSVVASGDGLGLPDELYDRMEWQRQRHGERVALAVHVRMHGVTGSGDSPLLLWCTAVLHGRPKGPFICPILGKPLDFFVMPV